MRRLVLILSAVFVATGFLSLATLSATAEPAAQYEPSDGASAPATTTPETTSQESTAPEKTAVPKETSSGNDFLSQGSVVGAHSAAGRAARKDIAEEARLPDYSQVVDNSTKGRFSAPGWKELRNEEGSYGGSYIGPDPGAKPARFKVKIPTTNDYSVYAWWPTSSNNSDASRFGVDTTSGTKWTEVDQSTDGGMWVKLGTYEMQKGERFVQIPTDSAGAGNVVADAVAVVRGQVSAPTDEQAAGGDTSKSGDSAYSTRSARNPTGRDVVRVARHYQGIRYKYATCTRARMSCTCLTKRTYAKFGHKMTLTERNQWRSNGAKRVAKSNLRPGDEVFFKESGASGPITHVGIYSGNGNLVHASSYFGKVVESKMKYINGYFGAKRYRLR